MEMQLWNRERVDSLKANALMRDEFVVISAGASPADSLQAATELGYPHFSHLKYWMPVYTKTERTF